MVSVQRTSTGSFCAIILLSALIEAGPVRSLLDIRQRRQIIESDTEISKETFKSIDTCLLNGYSVPRNSIICEKKPPGCRAIQKTNSCCADYLCDCEKSGKVYGNGEKIIDADNPCRVCYCQGGEITCNPVTCYSRTDCEPKYISGRCCPEFDNCPPLEHQKTPQSSETFENVQHNVISLNDNGYHAIETTTLTTTTEDVSNAIIRENPLGIKIKEITKPEEIRITNENKNTVNKQISTANKAGKDANHIDKGNTTISPPTSEFEANVSTSEDSLIYSSTSTEYPNALNDSDQTFYSNDEEPLKTVRQTEDFYESELIEDAELDNNKDKIDERESSKLTSIESNSEPGFLSSTTDQSYHQQSSPTQFITEITPSKEKSSPSVVQIGDSLVIVDHSQSHPISVIKVEEAAGLQRGEDDSNYENDTLDNEDLINLASSTPGSSSQSNEYSDMTTSATENGFKTTLLNDGSGLICDIGPVLIAGSGEVETSGGGEVATELNIPILPDDNGNGVDDTGASGNVEILPSFIGYSGEKVFETVYWPQTSIEPSSVEVVRDTTFYDTSSIELLSSNASNEASTSSSRPVSADLSEELLPVVQKTYIEDDESHVLISPGYGKIPDEFSLHSRSSAIQSEDEIMRKEHSQESMDGLEHPEMKAINYISTTHFPSELIVKRISQENIQYRSPGEPLLIPEWERNLTTISPLEVTDSSKTVQTQGSNHLAEILQETINAINHDKSSSEEIDKIFKKDVEPTTLKPTTPSEPKVSFSGEFSLEKTEMSPLLPKHYNPYNPKDDAESLKFESNEPIDGLKSYEQVNYSNLRAK